MLYVLIMASAALSALGQSVVFKVTPATLSFTHQAGEAKLPATQTLTIAGSAGFAVALNAGPWLTVSPNSGVAPVTARVTVNPTTLPVGTYSGTITVVTAEQAPQTAVVPVSLVVRAAPSSIAASASAITVNYVRGAPAPEPSSIGLATSGAVLSYTAATAGGTWLSVAPKSGVVFPAFPATVTVVTNPVGLAPGSYKGTVTISAAQASNKTVTVNVSLNVTAGAPSITSVWPNQVPQGSAATVVTVQGDNFFPGSVIKSGAVTLTSTYVGPNVISATLPANLLAAPAALPVVVTNPGTGGGDSLPQVVTVVPPGPIVAAMVHSATLATDAVAPGLLVTLFGSGLGPERSAVFTAAGGGVPLALANTRVLFGNLPAPILFASATQVGAVVPYGLGKPDSVEMRAEFNGVRSAPVTLPVVHAAPGIFTANSSGSGAAAAFGYDEASASYYPVTETATVSKGGLVLFYVTGDGIANPAASDGQIVTQPAAAATPALTVRIGGLEAPVLYAGGVVGLVSGITQINARVPDLVAPGKAVPVVVEVNGASSPPGVTIAVK